MWIKADREINPKMLLLILFRFLFLNFWTLSVYQSRLELNIKIGCVLLTV